MSVRTGRVLLLVGALGGMAAGLFACESGLSRRRVAICRRAVPALVTGGSELRVLRSGTGAAPNSARIDYVVGSRPHVALCRFDGGTDLVEVSADRETLNGASLYLLKRYYLDTPDAEAGDPAGH